MNLINALISGIRGAENGSAKLYKRGTSNPAIWYGSFEAAAPNASGSPITLDANGSAEVYVDELVDVEVKDSAGNVVRLFTQGDSAPPVEVRSQSFTGADYATAQSGAGKPTTLQSVLDLWLTKNGAIDWQVLFNGSSTTIKAALSMLNGKLFYNVKDDAFGATGAGTNDDTSAIQAAINAANAAGGGVVVFPKGTYKVSTTLTVPANIHLVGLSGPTSTTAHTCVLTMDHATADLLNFTGGAALNPQIIANLQLKASQSHSGNMVDGGASASVELINCIIGDGANASGDLVEVDFVTARYCSFLCAGATGRSVIESSAGPIALFNCYLRSTIGAYNPVSGMVHGRAVTAENCTFDMSGMTSGTARGFGLAAVGSTANLNVTHCTMGGPTGGTVHLFNFSAASITHLTRIFEDYNQASGSSALYAVNATPFTGDATAAAAPGTQSWNIHLGSRERRLIKVTPESGGAVTTPFDLNTLEYGFIVIKRTVAGVQTLTANAAVPNGKLTVMILNATGGASGNFTTGAGFYPGETFAIATNNRWDVRTYRGMDLLPNMRWLTDATGKNDI